MTLIGRCHAQYGAEANSQECACMLLCTGVSKNIAIFCMESDRQVVFYFQCLVVIFHCVIML